MRLDSPGHTDALEAVVADNARKERAALDKWADTHAQLMDHTAFVYRKLISGSKPHTFISRKSKGLDSTKRTTERKITE
ncbi:MAG: hypothetical protein ACRDGA_13325 [Bacteroidota bacterium]